MILQDKDEEWRYARIFDQSSSILCNIDYFPTYKNLAEKLIGV